MLDLNMNKKSNQKAMLFLQDRESENVPTNGRHF